MNRYSAQFARRWWWVPFLFGGLAALVWLWSNGRSLLPPILALDLNQHRADTVLPTPQGTLALEQSFRAGRDGLAEVEVALLRDLNVAGENGRLYFQLLAPDGPPIHESELPNQAVGDSLHHKLAFPPQPDSAGRVYTLRVSGSADNAITLRGYSLDVHAGGALRLLTGPLEASPPDTPAQELRLITRYQLAWGSAFRDLARLLAESAALLAVALLFLPLPGLLILLAGPPAWRRWDRFAWLGVAVALGVSFWAIFWQWGSLIGLRFSGPLLWSLVAGGWLLGVGRWWLVAGRWWPVAGGGWRVRAIPHSAFRTPHSALRTPHFHLEHIALLLLLLVGLAVRLLAVRDLAFLPWVDASRHGLITAVMVESGQIPANYGSYLPVDRFPYHFGFHVLSASLHFLTGTPLAPLLLYLGQLLNALVPLSMYAAAWLFSRSRRVGLVAALLVALPFFFPAYYLSWGRLTQLTAVLLLPVLLGLTYRLLRGGRAERRLWPLVGALAAGVFLVHFRVFLFYLPYAPLVWLAGRGRNGRYLAVAGGLGLLLVLPHLINLLRVTEPVAAVQRTMVNYNTFPVAYLTVGWERPFLYLAGGLFLLLLLPAFQMRRWTATPLVLAGWTAIVFILLAGDRLGLPETSLVNINSFYIITFIPLALFLGLMADRVWRWLGARHWLLQAPGWFASGAALLIVVAFGVRQQITVLNASTVLAHPADAAGLVWVNEHLPAEARVAASSWKWLGETWAGSDGGAWLLPLTGRQTTIPPIDHIYNRELFLAVRTFNQAATDRGDWSDPEAIAWLRGEGVSHIYVGARGGFFDPAALVRNPAARLLYSHEGVFIFALE